MSNVTVVSGNGSIPVASAVVDYFHKRRSISTKEANTVNAVVLAASAEVTEDDRTTLFSISDKQTDAILEGYDMVECTAFVDYAFANGWQHRDGIPDLFVKILQVFSRSIANKMLAGKQVESENVVKARNDWQAVACIVGQEVAYGSADCHVIQIKSIEPVAELYRFSNVVSKAGVSYQLKGKTTGYLVNGQYTCFANYDTDTYYTNLAQYKGCWFNVTESEGNDGKYALSCRKEKGKAVSKMDERTGKEVTRRPNIGITPTTSFLRTLYGLILSRFVSQERGGIAFSHNDLATETRDCRRAAGVRESDSDFDMVFDSPYFSDNDKDLVRALEITIVNSTEVYDEESDDLRKLVHNSFKTLGTEWHQNYEAITNGPAQYDKFRRMVRGLQKTIRRVFNRMAREVASEMPVGKLKETFVILPDVVDSVPVDYGIQLKARPILKSWGDIWNDIVSRPNYHPTPVMTTEPMPVTNFPCNVKLDTSIDDAVNMSDVVMTVTRCGHSYNIHASTDYVKSVLVFANTKMLAKHMDDTDRTIVELAKIGYGMPTKPKSTPVAPRVTKATELWELIRGRFHPISRTNTVCEYCDAI